MLRRVILCGPLVVTAVSWILSTASAGTGWGPTPEYLLNHDPEARLCVYSEGYGCYRLSSSQEPVIVPKDKSVSFAYMYYVDRSSDCDYTIAEFWIDVVDDLDTWDDPSVEPDVLETWGDWNADGVVQSPGEVYRNWWSCISHTFGQTGDFAKSISVRDMSTPMGMSFPIPFAFDHPVQSMPPPGQPYGTAYFDLTETAYVRVVDDTTPPPVPSVTAYYTPSNSSLCYGWVADSDSDTDPASTTVRYSAWVVDELENEVPGTRVCGLYTPGWHTAATSVQAVGAGHTYQVHVKVWNGVGLTSEGASGSAQLEETPPQVSVTDRGSESPIDSLDFTWSASDPESGVVSYQYAITESSSEPAFWSTATPAPSPAGGAMPTGEPFNGEPGKTYYCHVKASNAAGMSATAVTDGITVDPSFVYTRKEECFSWESSPFFPIGIYHYPCLGAPNMMWEITDARLQEISDAGFNLFRRCLPMDLQHLEPPDLNNQYSAVQAYLEKANSYGLCVLEGWGGWLGSIMTDTNGRVEPICTAFEGWVNALTCYPALFGYETVDEAVNKWYGQAQTRYSREQLTYGHCHLHSLAQHPVWACFGPADDAYGIPGVNRGVYQRWTSIGDVFGMDKYPKWDTSQHNQYPYQDVSDVSLCCEELRAMATRPNPEPPYCEEFARYPVYMVLEGIAAVNSNDSPPVVTVERVNGESLLDYRELRFMAYTSIIHRAKAILLYGNHYIQPTDPEWANQKRLAGELGYLQQVLAHGYTQPADSYTIPSDCEAILKVHGGHRYLIVANKRWNAGQSTGEALDDVQITCDWGQSGPRVLFENGRALDVQGGVITDDFEPWGVHVYTDQPDVTPPEDIDDLDCTGSTSTSVTLSWTAPGDDGAAGTAAAYDIRYSTGSSITSENWSSATRVQNPPTPLQGGSVEQFTVTGLQSNTTYYFAVDTRDEYHNRGGVSNSSSRATTQQ